MTKKRRRQIKSQVARRLEAVHHARLCGRVSRKEQLVYTDFWFDVCNALDDPLREIKTLRKEPR